MWSTIRLGTQTVASPYDQKKSAQRRSTQSPSAPSQKRLEHGHSALSLRNSLQTLPDRHSDSSNAFPGSFFTCSRSKTAHRSDDSERLTKRNKSRSFCRGPFLISTPGDSAEAADPSVQLILICQRHSTILIQESRTQNRLNSESLRTDTLTKFSQQTVRGIRVTSFDSSSRLVNIAAR